MGLEAGGRGGGVERKRKKEEKTPDKYHKFDFFFALEMHKPRIISIFPDPFGSFHLIHIKMVLF